MRCSPERGPCCPRGFGAHFGGRRARTEDCCPRARGRGAHSESRRAGAGGRTWQRPPRRLTVLAHRLGGGHGDTHRHPADPAVHPGHVNAPGAGYRSQSRNAGSGSGCSDAGSFCGSAGSRSGCGNASSQPTRQPPRPQADLKEELQKELSILREAQLHKDIVQFMSVYSLTYPGLDDKRANTLKAWDRFDFTNLVFTVDKIQSIDPDNTIAWVTWYIDTKNRSTKEMASGSQTYQVRFAKELGKWRIRSLEEVEP